MQTFDEHMAHVAECQQRAKTAPNENAQQSWLALADSWRHTAELCKQLERQSNFLQKAS